MVVTVYKQKQYCGPPMRHVGVNNRVWATGGPHWSVGAKIVHGPLVAQIRLNVLKSRLLFVFILWIVILILAII